jgi:hypothetical protein
MNDDQLKTELRSTYFAVEANSFEQLCLWRDSARDADRPTIHDPVLWVEKARGHILQIGELAGMPVTLALCFATINNIGVLFYHSPSQVTDHRMVEKWLDENVPANTWGGGRATRCDAMNFHQCLHATADRRDYLTGLIDALNKSDASASSGENNPSSPHAVSSSI